MTEESLMGPAEYLGHQLLLDLQESKGHVPKSVFFKTWCIGARYLEDEHGFDVKLPRYWFRYGELVDQESINEQFYFRRSTSWGQKCAPVYDIDRDEFKLPDGGQRLIDNAVKWVINRFGKRDSAFVRQHQYTVYSPNQFIRTYSELRDYLDYTNLEEQAPLTRYPDYESNQEIVEHLLDEMLVTYPEDGFSEMYDLYLRWDDTARMMLAQGPNFTEFRNFLEDFIEALSESVIRIEYNSSIPEERLEDWERRKRRVIQDYRENLNRDRADLLRTDQSSGVLEQVSESYDEAVLDDMSDMTERH